MQIVTSRLGLEEYGIPIEHVQEIKRVGGVKPMPNAVHYVDGIINLRGKIITIVDMRARIGMDRIPHDESSRIVITEYGGIWIGFVVDAVTEVMDVTDEHVVPLNESFAEGRFDCVTAVGKHGERLIMLVDVPTLYARASLPPVEAADIHVA